MFRAFTLAIILLATVPNLARAHDSNRQLHKNSALENTAGEKAEQEGNFSAAVELYSKSCAANFAAGCNNLASMYEKGLGVGRDVARALTILEKTCREGDATGCKILAAKYGFGLGVERDDRLSLHYHELACKNGSQNDCALIPSLRAITK